MGWKWRGYQGRRAGLPGPWPLRGLTPAYPQAPHHLVDAAPVDAQELGDARDGAPAFIESLLEVLSFHDRVGLGEGVASDHPRREHRGSAVAATDPKVFAVDRAGAQNSQPSDLVLKFSHVPRPCVREERLTRT